MTHEITFEVWDVFTEAPFGGNQLAVIPDARGLSPEEMQAITREFGFSETVFMLPPEQGGTIRLRIFTPAAEIPFAGHPTLGAAASLAHAGYAFGQPVPREVVIEEGAGAIDCTAEHSNGIWQASFTIATPFERGAALPLPETAACAGLGANDLTDRAHPPVVASKGLPFVIAETATREALSRAAPLREAIQSAQANLRGAPDPMRLALYYRTSPGTLALRMFAPLAGVEEDPATGSAAAALAALLCDLAGAPVALDISQGSEMGRPSRIFAEASRPAPDTSDVVISGPAVHVMTGVLYLPG
jgi:trans-2,3-dihydro-3-hydroxyanthranilate isomerase